MKPGPLLIILAALAATPAPARQPAVDEWQAVQESLSCIHPRLRSRWLNERGLVVPGENAPLPPVPDTGGLRLVGKFGRGPAFEVTGRDSLVYLSLGSEVAVVDFAHPDSPRVVAEVQANGLVRQAAVRDTILYVGAMWGGSPGVDIWSVASPDTPTLLGHIPTMLQDFCVRDTCLYVTQALDAVLDTFKVYSVADPANPYLLGTCRDSGSAITVTNGAAFLADRWGLYVVDVTDPANPHRIGSYPGVPLSVEGRGNICCVTFANPNQPDWLQFEVLNVTNPATPTRFGYLSNTGGYDMYLDDTFAYVSGYYTGGHEFKILSIADSTQPRLVGTCATPGEGWGVWVSRPQQKAYFADYPRGLSVVDIAVPAAPAYDTSLLRVGSSEDVSVQGGLAGVASQGMGMILLDVSAPSAPVQLGVVDSTKTMTTRAVALQDSFAYMGFSVSWYGLRSVDITDPMHPVTAGGVLPFNPVNDIVPCDSWLYVAEMSKFEVYNVARPREPVLVGSCVAGDATSAGLALQDTLAFVGNDVSQVINVADPAGPAVVGTFYRGAWNVAPRDTFAFVSSGGVIVYNVADPTTPHASDSISLGPNTYWVEAVGNLLYTGNRDGVHVVDASDVHNMREVGFCSTPYSVKRVAYSTPYVYAACWDAGVCIFDTFQLAIAEPGRSEPRRAFGIRPTVTRGVVHVQGGGMRAEGGAGIPLLDVAGRRVAVLSEGRNDLSHLSPGVYFVRERPAALTKLVIQR